MDPMGDLDDRRVVFEYLDGLRESGVTNMFGARLYVMEEFKVSRSDATFLLSEWMNTFDKRHPPENTGWDFDADAERQAESEVFPHEVEAKGRDFDPRRDGCIDDDAPSPIERLLNGGTDD